MGVSRDMNGSSVDRRRGRRIDLRAPVLIRRLADQHAPFSEETSHNVSLAGVYFETDAARGYQVNDLVVTSISIPEAHTRGFPFTRLAGKSRVVRIFDLPSQPDQKRVGVALEFGDDLTALTALPARG